MKSFNLPKAVSITHKSLKNRHKGLDNEDNMKKGR